MPRYIGRNLDSTINNSPGDQHWSNVSLLLRMDGSDASTTFTDSSATARTFTANGNAQIDTAQSKFGGASGLFDGTGDYITTPNSADFRFGSGDFTIESWVYLNAIGQFHPIANQMTNSNRGWMFDVTSGNKLRLYGFISSWQELGISTTSLATGQWYHCAVTRDGTSFRLFLNGVLEDTTVISGAFTEETSVAFTVGYIGDGSLSRYVNGWIDDLRITKGVARHTASFNIPDAPFPVGAKTTGHTDNKYNSGIWSISGGGDDSINTRRRSGKWPKNNGATVLSRAYSFDWLVVGGGGGGGCWVGGGGGAGGYRSAVPGEASGGGTSAETPLASGALASGVYTVTIGAGGAGSSQGSSAITGASGSNSVLGSITSVGGGRGASWNVPALVSQSGGSGGGINSGQTGGAFAGTAGQGYAGGIGQGAPNYSGSGGGGAGAVGQNAGPSGAGNGGVGVQSSINGTATYRAGGGGGGVHTPVPSSTDTVGGAGGGGAGIEGNDASGTATSGTAGTGGGGGGHGLGPSAVPVSQFSTGGAGGSGIVIIRYSGGQRGSGGTVTSSGGYTIHTFTTSGTYTA